MSGNSLPRIRREYGIWVCRTTDYLRPGEGWRFIAMAKPGYGYTPAEAYWDWKRQ